MKRRYEKPIVEIENYELDANIASNCKRVITMGPVHPSHTVCDSYYQASGEPDPRTSEVSLFANYNVDFWENCDCYTSASGLYFTS